jgi:hypothetical protein
VVFREYTDTPTVTLFGETRIPATQDGTNAGPTVTLAPPTSMVAGQLVLVYLNYRGAVTWSNSTTGGQTWSSSANTQQSTTTTARLFWCIFNGTWSADPVFTVTTGTAGASGWMMVYDYVDVDAPWETTPVITAQAAGTFTIADYNTASDMALALCGAASSDNNTWKIDNSFFHGRAPLFLQNSSGTDNSIIMARRRMGNKGAVGATVMTQVTVGTDAGVRFYGALRKRSIWLGGGMLKSGGVVGTFA